MVIIKNILEKIGQQLEQLWHYAENIALENLKDKRPSYFHPVTPEQVHQTIKQINTELIGNEVDKKVTQKLNYAQKHWPAHVTKYNEKEQILNERNSYSKTDADATSM